MTEVILDKIEHFLEKVRWYRTVVVAAIIVLVVVHIMSCM
jgi:hypothetical protein